MQGHFRRHLIMKDATLNELCNATDFKSPDLVSPEKRKISRVFSVNAVKTDMKVH